MFFLPLINLFISSPLRLTTTGNLYLFGIFFDIKKERIIVEPGVTLEQLDNYLERYNYFYPPNPTESKASIGGNVATNASGSRSFKYGATRNFIMRLKILLSDGTILDIERGKNFAKNNKVVVQGDNKIFDTELSIPSIFMISSARLS